VNVKLVSSVAKSSRCLSWNPSITVFVKAGIRAMNRTNRLSETLYWFQTAASTASNIPNEAGLSAGISAGPLNRRRPKKGYSQARRRSGPLIRNKSLEGVWQINKENYNPDCIQCANNERNHFRTYQRNYHYFRSEREENDRLQAENQKLQENLKELTEEKERLKLDNDLMQSQIDFLKTLPYYSQFMQWCKKNSTIGEKIVSSNFFLITEQTAPLLF